MIQLFMTSITGIGYDLYTHDLTEQMYNIFSKAKYLYIDTEALGLSLHRDRLCLIQILSDNYERVSLIQISKDVQPHPLLTKLFNNPNIIKVFHYAIFDMSIIQKYLNNIKWTNVICTKILSKIVRTFSDRHGLVTLCKEMLSINLLKDSQSSDWGMPVLTDQQKAYAANDVIYLRSIYEKLCEKAIRENKLYIAEEAFKTLPIAVNILLQGFELQSLLNHA